MKFTPTVTAEVVYKRFPGMEIAGRTNAETALDDHLRRQRVLDEAVRAVLVRDSPPMLLRNTAIGAQRVLAYGSPGLGWPWYVIRAEFARLWAEGER